MPRPRCRCYAYLMAIPGGQLGEGAAISMMIVPFFDPGLLPDQAACSAGGRDGRRPLGASRASAPAGPPSLGHGLDHRDLRPADLLHPLDGRPVLLDVPRVVKTNKEIYQDFTFCPPVWYWGTTTTADSPRRRSWLRNSTIVVRWRRRCSRSSSARSGPTRSPGSSSRPPSWIARAGLHLPGPGVAAVHPAVPDRRGLGLIDSVTA